MTVLVTGATGFIGRELLAQLVDCGIAPIALARTATKSDLKVEAVDIDISQKAALSGLTHNVDQVVHLAANVSRCDGPSCFQENVYGSYAVANWATKIGARLLYVSTTGVYGTPAQSGRVTEASPVRPGRMYTLTKYLGEITALQEEPNALILRLSYVYGPGDTGSMASHVIRQVVQGKPVVVRNERRDLLYVSDAAAAIVRALGYKGSENTFNIGAGILTSLAQVSRIAMTAAHVTVPIRIQGSRASVTVDVTRVRKEANWHAVVGPDDGVKRVVFGLQGR